MQIVYKIDCGAGVTTNAFSDAYRGLPGMIGSSVPMKLSNENWTMVITYSETTTMKRLESDFCSALEEYMANNLKRRVVVVSSRRVG